MANYQRILEIGGASSPADAAIVGDEASVRSQLQSLLDAGATDIWAAPFPVGDDPKASLRRTRELLMDLVDAVTAPRSPTSAPRPRRSATSSSTASSG